MVHAVSSIVSFFALALCIYQLVRQDRFWHPIRGIYIAFSTALVVYFNFKMLGPKWDDIWFMLHAMTGATFFGILFAVVIPSGLYAWCAKRPPSVVHYFAGWCAMFLLAVSLFFAFVSSLARLPM